MPDFLHEEFKRAVDYEHPDAAERRLKIFYEATEHGWPPGAIGDDPIKLWRQEFAAKFPSVAPVKVGTTDVLKLAQEKLQRDDAKWGKR